MSKYQGPLADMAASMTDDMDDNDFILTISDNEASLSNIEEEEELPQSAAPTKRGIKRKRDAQDTTGQDRAGDGSTSKAKKVKRGSAKAQPMDESGSEDGPSWAANGEDDGAMDSDFEFQIGDVDTGVVEDFDGWGLGKTGQAQATAFG